MISFDPGRGLGVVRDDDGEDFRFHCTAVTDGSLHIDPGLRVVFVVAPGHLGRFEARSISALE